MGKFNSIDTFEMMDNLYYNIDRMLSSSLADLYNFRIPVPTGVRNYTIQHTFTLRWCIAHTYSTIEDTILDNETSTLHH